MRIVLVGSAWPLRGGIAHYVALLARSLESAGHQVKVVSFSRQYPSLLFPGKTQQDSGDEPLRVDSEALIDTINPLSWFKAAKAIAEWKPDLVAFKYWMPFFAPAYGTIVRRLKARGIPSVYILDNVVPHEGRPGDSALTKYALSSVKGFIAQSKSVREDLLKFRPQAVCLDVPHPVYSIFPEGKNRTEARRSLGVSADQVILFFGFIRGYKGLLNLFDALSLIPASRSLQLLVGGEFYEDDAPYRKKIETLGIQDRVILHDRYIPNEEVGDFFNAANLVVLPYNSATQSGIIQIAFNYDKPVITTDVGGLPEVVRAGELGEVVPAGDPQALAQAIETYFDRGDENAYSTAVAKEKQKYSWQALVDALQKLAHE